MHVYTPNNGLLGLMMRFTFFMAGFNESKENGDPTPYATVPGMKASKGLEALHIDFNQFNMRPYMKNKSVLSAMLTFNEKGYDRIMGADSGYDEAGLIEK
jgi:hypothetical protein